MTVADLRGIVAHASRVPADERGALAERLRSSRPSGAVLVETCHRVELHGVGEAAFAPLATYLPPGTEVMSGRGVAEHVVALAVGLRSAVVAEDQILYQLRRSHEAASRTADRSVEIHRLFELALRAGRRARSWLPARRPTLADVALDLVREPIAGRPVLVVGTGEMGGLAVVGALRRGALVSVAGRTPGRAAALARAHDVVEAPFDPGSAASGYVAVVVALRGPWAIGRGTREHLVAGRATVVDLSAPPAVPAPVRAALGSRLIMIDDLARQPADALGDPLIRRLTALAATTVDAYVEWVDQRDQRTAAQAMSERAEAARREELGRLWRRLPDLGSREREAIEEMSHQLATQLLRDPLTRLGDDRDGRRAQAARDLFDL